MPTFDGETYDEALDRLRLGRQLFACYWVMQSGEWYTLAQLARAITLLNHGRNCSEASASARLRDLRKERFGGYCIERARVDGQDGLWHYRMGEWPTEDGTCADELDPDAGYDQWSDPPDEGHEAPYVHRV